MLLTSQASGSRLFGSTMLCPRCATENEPGRKFCAECGSPLSLACPVCGGANSPGAKFCGECGSPLTSEAVPAAPAAEPRAPTAPVAERRFVSVLFADLVGFTTLSESRDAEEVRELLSRYFESCRRLISLYGGTVPARASPCDRCARAARSLVRCRLRLRQRESALPCLSLAYVARAEQSARPASSQLRDDRPSVPSSLPKSVRLARRLWSSSPVYSKHPLLYPLQPALLPAVSSASSRPSGPAEMRQVDTDQ
jgi:hypothetical protein